MIDTGALRKKILKLAVTGNLSKQMDSDTPVSKELEVYVPAQLDIELEEIPDSWKYCKFDEVIINRDSERIPVSVADRKKLDKIYDYYGASGVIDKVDKYLFDKDLLLIGEDGANLLSRSTPIVFIARGKYWVNNHAHVLDATEHILLEYAALIINSMSLVPYVTGAAQPKLSQGMMNKIALPVAPLEEQKRIVDTVKTAFEMLDQIDKLQKQYSSDLEVLKSKIIDAGIQGKLTEQLPEDGTAEELLEQIREKKDQMIKEGLITKESKSQIINDEDKTFDVPKNWAYARVQDVATYITDYVANGSFATLKANTTTYKEPNYAVFVRTLDLGAEFKNDLSYIDEASYEFLKKSKLYGGELILPNIGASIGKAFIMPDLGMPMSLAPNSVMIKFENATMNKYFYYVFQSSYGKGILMNIQGGAATPKFSKTDLRKMVVMLPPLAEQERIVNKIEEIFELL